MALKKDIEAILNRQIEQEFDAAVVYYGMYAFDHAVGKRVK
jgi:hypothetical protein